MQRVGRPQKPLDSRVTKGKIMTRDEKIHMIVDNEIANIIVKDAKKKGLVFQKMVIE